MNPRRRFLSPGATIAGAGVIALLATLALRSATRLSAGPPPGGGGGGATRIDPRPSRAGPVDLAPGRHLLLGLLQQFADHAGETVWVTDEIAADREIVLDRRLLSLEAKRLGEVLEANGLAMSWERYRSENAYLVRTRLKIERGKRGRLVRRGAASTETGASSPAGTAPREGAGFAPAGVAPALLEESAGSGVRLLQTVDGGARKWVVRFETRSREEAVEVARTLDLILADRRKRPEPRR